MSKLNNKYSISDYRREESEDNWENNYEECPEVVCPELEECNNTVTDDVPDSWEEYDEDRGIEREVYKQIEEDIERENIEFEISQPSIKIIPELIKQMPSIEEMENEYEEFLVQSEEKKFLEMEKEISKWIKDGKTVEGRSLEERFKNMRKQRDIELEKWESEIKLGKEKRENEERKKGLEALKNVEIQFRKQGRERAIKKASNYNSKGREQDIDKADKRTDNMYAGKLVTKKVQKIETKVGQGKRATRKIKQEKAKELSIKETARLVIKPEIIPENKPVIIELPEVEEYEYTKPDIKQIELIELPVIELPIVQLPVIELEEKVVVEKPIEVEDKWITIRKNKPEPREPKPEQVSFTRLCNSITSGAKCIHGSRCNFAHSLDKIQHKNCIFQNGCRYVQHQGHGMYINTPGKFNGKVCNFWHPEETNKSYGDRMGLKFNTNIEPMRKPIRLELKSR